jgi:hypothetical protein
MTTRFSRFVAVVGVALAFGACGDDEPTVTATTSSSVATATTVPTTTAAPGATTTTLRAGVTTTAPVTSSCATVGFTPNSEDAASSVTATGLSCAEAEAFVRVAGTQTSSGGPQAVDVEGYQCVATASTQDPLPTTSYSCTNGPKKVTFVRS